MNKVKSIFICSLVLLISSMQEIHAQELNAKVQILSPGIQLTNTNLFDDMRKKIENFLNSRKWTEEKFTIEERIDLSIVITIKKESNQSNFEGEIQMVSSRPVFNSSYNSTMLRIIDKKLEFTFSEFEPLEFMEGAYTNNLTSVLAFYAYLAIGVDYDSYSLFGGTDYLNKALNVVNAAESSGMSGWGASERGQSNRYWLVFQLLDERFRPMRKMLYEYHRLGLDTFTDNMDKGRKTVLTALKYLSEVQRNQPNSYVLTVIMDAKRIEIMDIFSKANAEEAKEVLKVAESIDIANSSKYREKLIK